MNIPTYTSDNDKNAVYKILLPILYMCCCDYVYWYKAAKQNLNGSAIALYINVEVIKIVQNNDFQFCFIWWSYNSSCAK